MPGRNNFVKKKHPEKQMSNSKSKPISHYQNEWPLWEVFYQPGNGKPFEHAGSVHAPDAEMALQNARDTYARRNEGIAIWVVPTDQITATTPEDSKAFFDPAGNKPYRHPQFYSTPRAVKKRK